MDTVRAPANSAGSPMVNDAVILPERACADLEPIVGRCDGRAVATPLQNLLDCVLMDTNARGFLGICSCPAARSQRSDFWHLDYSRCLTFSAKHAVNGAPLCYGQCKLGTLRVASGCDLPSQFDRVRVRDNGFTVLVRVG